MVFYSGGVDGVVLFVGSDPDDPEDGFGVVDFDDEAVAVAFDVEDDAGGGEDAGGCVGLLDRRCIGPRGFFGFGEPGIQ